jgi:hypothetical protein
VSDPLTRISVRFPICAFFKMSLFLFLTITLLLTKFGDTSGLIDAPISHTGTTNIAGFIESGELCFVSDSISLKEKVVIDKKKRKFHLLYDDVCYAVAGHLVMDDTYLTRLCTETRYDTFVLVRCNE